MLIYPFFLFALSVIYYSKVIGIATGNSLIFLTKSNNPKNICLEGIACPVPIQVLGQKIYPVSIQSLLQ
jgi:hypothetical protein